MKIIRCGWCGTWRMKNEKPCPTCGHRVEQTPTFSDKEQP